MEKFTIAVIVGSLRDESLNRKLAIGVQRLAPKNFTFKMLSIGELPLYNQDHDADQAQSVKNFKAEIKAADGILFVTPEYNRSIPGVLKNAIDHASRPYGDNVWAGKPAGIIGISIGMIGTALAQQHLRNILVFLDMPTLSQPEVFIQDKEGLFDADGNIGPDSKEFLQSWVDAFVNWIKLHNA